MKGIYMDES